jgi:hypothetical protein
VIGLPIGTARAGEVAAAADRRLSMVSAGEAEVAADLKRAQALRQAVLARAFGVGVSSAAA